MTDNRKTIFYVMGVSGCGKSTIGALLAEKLGVPFYDGDDYHPDSNIRKMKAGIPLNDKDRRGWLIKLNQIAAKNSNRGAVISCSALKEIYRRLLAKGIEEHTEWIYLEGSFSGIMDRLKKRSGHFMPADLLQSQFDTLEPPENCIKVSVTGTPDEIVSGIISLIQ